MPSVAQRIYYQLTKKELEAALVAAVNIPHGYIVESTKFDIREITNGSDGPLLGYDVVSAEVVLVKKDKRI